MSIPLDRLYHYLESLCSDDIVIYRWNPHGSKKLEDLKLLNDDKINSIVYSVQDVKLYLLNNLICHDQEPLQYDLYTLEDFLHEIKRTINSRLEDAAKRNEPAPAWCHSEKFVNLMATAHLRNMIKLPSNLNDYTLLCHSEKNSEQLKIYEQNYFIGVYYWSHALIARDWFRFAELDNTLIPKFENISKDFLIYNRAWSGTREYRLKFVELLTNQNLLNSCNIKFSSYDTGLHYTDHKFKNPEFAISRHDFEYCIPENTTDSGASADYNNKDYQSSAIEVVLETLFDDSRQHMTEKILRPIACGRPFMLVGTPGSLQYLKDYGFKTFNGLINEDYDNIKDPVERLQFITNEMQRLSKLDPTTKLDVWTKLYEIAEYNKKRFFSKEFHDFVSNEFVENLNKAIAISKQHITGKWLYLYSNPDIVGPVTARGLVNINRLRQVLKEYGTFNYHPWPTVE